MIWIFLFGGKKGIKWVKTTVAQRVVNFIMAEGRSDRHHLPNFTQEETTVGLPVQEIQADSNRVSETTNSHPRADDVKLA